MNELILKIISIAAIFIILKILILFMLDALKIKYPLRNMMIKYRAELLFIVSLAGVVGSILLSIYFKFQACELCWYQRVFLFPLPIITAIGVLKKDSYARLYVFCLSFIGLIIAMYHSLIQSQLFVRDTIFCNPNALVDCSVPYFTYFGFVTIPVIACSVFLLISYIAYVQRKD
ncbi:MAG: hypothetical protein RLY49_137 [Candidatus Parcubacteria bacterium]|jgi:disulfide bond formation protein DsbB